MGNSMKTLLMCKQDKFIDVKEHLLNIRTNCGWAQEVQGRDREAMCNVNRKHGRLGEEQRGREGREI